MSVKVHEAYSIDSFQDRLLWWDDFLGDQLQDEWATAFVGAGTIVVVDAQTGGVIRLTTAGALNDNCSLDWGDIRSLLVTQKVCAETRLILPVTTNVRIEFALHFDNSNRIRFRYDSATGVNWRIITSDGGANTTQDSGVAITTGYVILRMECHTHGANHVHFYIDGTETALSPITTNVPDDAADVLQPRFFIGNNADASRIMDVDYVAVRQEI